MILIKPAFDIRKHWQVERNNLVISSVCFSDAGPTAYANYVSYYDYARAPLTSLEKNGTIPQ